MRAALGHRAIFLLVLGVVSAVAIAPPVRAQVNLPPPPPPPLDNGNSGSTTSSGTGNTGTSTGSSSHTKPKPRPKSDTPPARNATPQPTQAGRDSRPPPPPPRASEPESPRTISIRLNPLPFFLSRLSADFEFMLAPHHALFVSPNVTLHKFAFHRSEIIDDALGYAGDNSSGLGAEVGYHYWVRRQLEGIYVGPALVFGETTPNGGKAFGYYGAAIDVGYQYLFNNGFTLNAGGGILVVGASGTSAHAAPRFLFGLGWSF